MDRNNGPLMLREKELKSLSARRAWIEIVGLRYFYIIKITSLSARRAWIEIGCALSPVLAALVALRKESVDRNLL